MLFFVGQAGPGLALLPQLPSGGHQLLSLPGIFVYYGYLHSASGCQAQPLNTVDQPPTLQQDWPLWVFICLFLRQGFTMEL